MSSERKRKKERERKRERWREKERERERGREGEREGREVMQIVCVPPPLFLFFLPQPLTVPTDVSSSSLCPTDDGELFSMWLHET
jgi:hypothetical protein